MITLTCCQITASRTQSFSSKAADGKAHPSSGKQRWFALAKFSLSALVLALLPKCPACFAAYIALGTGISVSVAAASFLKTLLVAICVGMLIWFLASAFRSVITGRLRPHNRLY
jgi:Fe2+ transport system protein B